MKFTFSQSVAIVFTLIFFFFGYLCDYYCRQWYLLAILSASFLIVGNFSSFSDCLLKEQIACSTTKSLSSTILTGTTGPKRTPSLTKRASIILFLTNSVPRIIFKRRIESQGLFLSGCTFFRLMLCGFFWFSMPAAASLSLESFII
jgi:hypothetical protein